MASISNVTPMDDPPMDDTSMDLDDPRGQASSEFSASQPAGNPAACVVAPMEADTPRRAAPRGASWRSSKETDFKKAFLAHAEETAPATEEDKKQDADGLAEQIVPNGSLNCAAVVTFFRGERPYEEFVVAYATNDNNPAPTSEHITELSQEWWGACFERIYNPRKIHCELVLFEKFGSNYYIGISKPCCPLCQLALRAAGYEQPTRGCHGKTFSTGWMIPDWVKENPEILKGFLGPDAFKIYDSLGSEGKRHALGWIQGGCGK